MRKALEIGGILAAAVLIAFGIAAVVLGMNGRDTVSSSLTDEQIYGSGDMSPSTIQPEVKAAQAQQEALFRKLDAAGIKFNGQEPIASPISAPGCTVANEQVNSGSEARCFAQYMRIHTFLATSGLTYSQMGRYQAKDGAPFKATDGLGGTNDPQYAKVDPKTQQPVSNGRRDIWVTYTSLTTALNASYMADQLGIFGVVVGVALLLAGIGFGILTLLGALRSSDSMVRLGRKEAAEPAAPVS